ncbi:hypothetical protein SAMN02745244_00603 [Tessaracoccus bendigoensis DSM 12906]|uniref:Uncharacterized protein n=1 Tax=Tessaracoccus bendigoensis DSM 12906 TaxID=1123357 RepID=A0A1M6C3H2_9ACTN|nr:hypothetical protein [Tessaracoccus bendigoensis]SHI55566.1 hypothetical protein SAMN02745244_00603 [Tessaracoccus bendigoensis DSM 12906]
MNLLPLEVLPGWPEPAPMSDLHMWLLLIIGPLAFGLVVTLIAFAPKLARGTSTEGSVPARALEPRQE